MQVGKPTVHTLTINVIRVTRIFRLSFLKIITIARSVPTEHLWSNSCKVCTAKWHHLVVAKLSIGVCIDVVVSWRPALEGLCYLWNTLSANMYSVGCNMVSAYRISLQNILVTDSSIFVKEITKFSSHNLRESDD